MPENLEVIFIIGSVLVLLSVLVSKIAERFGIPLLLLFLLLGMVAGSEGLGGIHFDDPVLTQWIATITLSIILFSGGVDTDWKSVKPLFREGLLLATLGVMITAAIVALFSRFVLQMSWQVSLLIGAIASSTDAAAVFTLLRAKGIRLKRSLAPLLELESGSNDPMAIFLTIGTIQWIQNTINKPSDLLLLFLMQMGIGLIAGWLISKAALFLINRLKLGYEGLYPVLTFALVFLTFGLASLLGGSGYLAVYVLGLLLGKEDFLHKRSLVRFFDGNAWLMQIALFITLGLLVFPSELKPVIFPGFLVSFVLIFLARPAAVFLTLIPFRYTLREKFFISWVGLRGAVPIVLGTFPLVAGISDAGAIFNLVFFIVITSVLLQGTLLPQVAHWLKVDAPMPSDLHRPIEVVSGQGLKADLREIQITASSPAVNKAIYQLKLPAAYLIILVLRDREYIQPNGSLELKPGDILFSLSEEDIYQQAQVILTGIVTST